MAEPRIDLDWWPPDLDDPLGEERARELMQRLREIAGIVIAAAEDDLRNRSTPDTGIVRGEVPLRYFARARLSVEMRSLCVGVVYEARGSAPQQNSIQLMRDGRLTWRRD